MTLANKRSVISVGTYLNVTSCKIMYKNVVKFMTRSDFIRRIPIAHFGSSCVGAMTAILSERECLT